jgi:hypothetical protein
MVVDAWCNSDRALLSLAEEEQERREGEARVLDVQLPSPPLPFI